MGTKERGSIYHYPRRISDEQIHIIEREHDRMMAVDADRDPPTLEEVEASLRGRLSAVADLDHPAPLVDKLIAAMQYPVNMSDSVHSLTPPILFKRKGDMLVIPEGVHNATTERLEAEREQIMADYGKLGQTNAFLEQLLHSERLEHGELREACWAIVETWRNRLAQSDADMQRLVKILNREQS